jgi:hypothetical protein
MGKLGLKITDGAERRPSPPLCGSRNYGLYSAAEMKRPSLVALSTTTA